jgi:hypothetical protein
MLYLDSSPMRVNIFVLKKKKKKRNDSYLHQRRNKEIYKLPYMEHFAASVECFRRQNFVPAEMYKYKVGA